MISFKKRIGIEKSIESLHLLLTNEPYNSLNLQINLLNQDYEDLLNIFNKEIVIMNKNINDFKYLND